jgi:hypothetical protein
MHNILETVRLILTSRVVASNLLLHLVLLLTSKCLLELQLLLHLLLFVSQNGVFTLWLTTRLIIDGFLGVLVWSHDSTHEGIGSIHHHGALLGLGRRHVH